MKGSKTTVSLIMAIGLLALNGVGSITVAQDDDRTATSASAGVGAWLVTLVEGPYTLPRQMILHADGTALQWDGAAVWTGSWEATGPSTGAITLVRYELDDAGYVVHDNDSRDVRGRGGRPGHDRVLHARVFGQRWHHHRRDGSGDGDGDTDRARTHGLASGAAVPEHRVIDRETSGRSRPVPPGARLFSVGGAAGHCRPMASGSTC